MTFVSSTRGGVWDSATRTITWNLDNLASGAHFIATVTATIEEQGGKTLINTVQAKDDQMDNPVSTTASINVKKCQLFRESQSNPYQNQCGKNIYHHLQGR